MHHSRELGGPFFRGHLIPSMEGLTPTDKLVLAVLVSYDFSLRRGKDLRKGFCFPSTESLANELCLSAATIKRCLRSLQDRFFVFRTHQRLGNGKRDIRFVHLNYAKLETGHRAVLAWRSARSESKRSEIQSNYASARLGDDVGFLHRLVIEGWAALSEITRAYPAPRKPHPREVIHELLNALDGSQMHRLSRLHGLRGFAMDELLHASPHIGEEDEVSIKHFVEDGDMNRSQVDARQRRMLARTLRSNLSSLSVGPADATQAIGIFFRTIGAYGLSRGDAESVAREAIRAIEADGYSPTEFAAEVDAQCRDCVAALRYRR